MTRAPVPREEPTPLLTPGAGVATVDAPALRRPDRLIGWVSYGYGLLMALALGHFLLGLPIQLSDSFGQMLKLSASWGDLLYGEFTQRGFMRPLMWGELKLVYDLSGGNYFAWFRGIHAAQVVLLVLLYVRLVRPATLRDVMVLPLGLAVLFGLHTFQGTVREAFPLNHFMTVLLYCFAAANLVFARYRWWTDVLAVLLFAVSALTIESGLLVWVIFAGGAIVGGRGVSRVGLAALAVLLAAYFVLRFPVFGVGSPDLMERSSGFGFRILEPSELVERFGDNPLGFYLYNVCASALSVLFSEPTGGVFRLTDQILRGELDAAGVVSPLSSLCATALVAVFAWRRRHAWLSRQLDRDDRLVLLCAMVLAANAVISYPYVKDVVMSPAGAFFAVAVFVAARSVLDSLPRRVPPHVAAVVIAAFAVLGTTWAIRVAGTHVGLRRAAYTERNEWAYAEESLRAEGVTLAPHERTLFRQLQDDALFTHPAPPPLGPPFRDLLGAP